MGRPIYLIAALALFTPAGVQAEHYNDLATQCTAGSLRACGSTDVALNHEKTDAGAKLSVLRVKLTQVVSKIKDESGSGGSAETPAEFASKYASTMFRPDPTSSMVSSKGGTHEVTGPSTGASCTTGADCAMVTPEPATLALLGTGLLGIAGAGALRRRRRIAWEL